MKNLRLSSDPRVWAKSRHHGPTNWDGPNPTPSGRAHLRRLLFGDGAGLPAAVYALGASLLFTAGYLAAAEFGYRSAFPVVLWCLAAVVAFGNRARRGEVFLILVLMAIVGFLLWYFLGRSY